MPRSPRRKAPRPTRRRALETQYESLANLLTDQEAAHMHLVLAAYHALRVGLATQDVMHKHHEELAKRLTAEAKRIRERQKASRKP
jgi:hypothetical protein